MPRSSTVADSGWYPRAVHHYTYREYLEFEQHANVRHEFLGGVIVAMAGGSRAHSRRCVRISAALAAQLAGRPCEVHSPDMKVHVLATGLVAYPDVTVVCGHVETDGETDHVITNPIVIVEVLSPSTEAWDREEKVGHYQQIPSLREIVLVAHDAKRLDVWRRERDGSWAMAVYEGLAQLPSIGCSLDVADVYAEPLAAE
jgi:Uma2 family endonuclease